MIGGDPVDGRADALADHRQRLGAGRRTVLRRPQPRAVGVAGLRPDLVDGAAFPLPEGELAQLLDHGQRDPALAQRQLGGLPRPAERAHVGGAHSAAAERAAQRLGLGAAARRQPDVGVALEAPLGVPDRFGVPRQ